MIPYVDIVAAAEHIRGVAHRTPIATSRTLDERLGARVLLKCEQLQRTGAFKFRGAYNAISQLSPEARARGVVAYSSGNHAQAVALSSKLLGLQATIVMPDDSPRPKREATAGYGARIITYKAASESREEIARRVQEETGAVLIPPFDHPHVIAGQGTVAREMFEDVTDLETLLVPCGGAGLLSGSAIAARHLTPACRVIGVEPEAGDDATRSFRTGTLQTIPVPNTIADGARTTSLGLITFPLVQAHVDDMVTVTDAEIVTAMRFLWERMKLVVEPTGAMGLAAALAGKVPMAGRFVGIILSGGNVDLAAALRLFAADDSGR